MAVQFAPFYPIIYVRGYAMTPGEIADTTASPYMGFNLGSTKSIIIYRYYETADADLGTGTVLSIPEAAQGLKALIHSIKRQVCEDDAAKHKQFKVHLVAHSMGGLVVRAFLQNDKISNKVDRALVDKVFTYATPHNGIEMAGVNVPSILGLWDMNNFNRKKMAEYLGLKGKPERVDTLDGKFDPQRFFCFVGTNHRDHEAALGMSRRLAGEMSDGLVKIENATIAGAPRAFGYRSHSGPYGVVNAEEGYHLAVSSTGYTVDKKLWLKQYIEGEYLFRNTLILRITRTANGFNVRYLHGDDKWGESTGTLAEASPDGYVIPLESAKGFKGSLCLNVTAVRQ